MPLRHRRSFTCREGVPTKMTASSLTFPTSRNFLFNESKRPGKTQRFGLSLNENIPLALSKCQAFSAPKRRCTLRPKAASTISMSQDVNYKKEIMFSSVVFDMDGTMTVSNIDFQEMRIRTGIPVGDLFTVMESWEDEERVNDAYEAILHLEAQAANSLQIQPGLMEVLGLLRQNGANLGLVTRNTTVSVDAFFKKVKPDKRLLQHVSQFWGVGPSDVLMVGDSREDVECGNAAGTKTCLIQGGGNEVSSGPEPSGAEPTFRVNSLFGLRDILRVKWGNGAGGENVPANGNMSGGIIPGLSFTDALFATNVLRGSFCSYPRLAGAFGGLSASTYPGDSVAHLGCGDGGLTKMLASQGLKVQGFELDAELRELASKRGLEPTALSLAKGKSHIRQGTLGRAENFNTVLSYSEETLKVSENISLPNLPWGAPQDADEIWRVLKLGGRFALEHKISLLISVDSLEIMGAAIQAMRIFKMAFEERGFIVETCSTEEKLDGVYIRVVALKPGIQKLQYLVGFSSDLLLRLFPSLGRVPQFRQTVVSMQLDFLSELIMSFVTNFYTS